MLQLDQTEVMLDGLKPPPGMEIDIAVGATFTLDLTALLAVPVAATFATQDLDRESASLLETIRRYAERTVLFCQAGAMNVPSTYRAALSLIEQTVVEVRKPAGGIFHPKVWVVRFAGRGETLHRVLVMSRNLTLDRSWDVIVRLDEDPETSRTVRTGELTSFLNDLAARAARDLQSGQRAMLTDLVGSIGRASLVVPEPFDAGRVVHLSGHGSRWPFSRTCRNALAISPFLTANAAGRFISAATHRSEVVSRRAALDSAAPGLRGATRLLRLRETVLDAECTVDDTFDAPEDEPAGGQRRPADALHGLHAKVFVQEDQARATCWLGSANLTTGAFRTNVELLVELSGPVGAVGTRAVLATDTAKNNLAVLLEDHQLPAEDADGDDEEISILEGHVLDLSSGDVTLTLEPAGEHWDGHLGIAPWNLPPGMTVHARLLSLENDPPIEVVDGAATWLAITQDRITPFVVLEGRLGQERVTRLVRATLKGDPEDRRRSVIANAISSREDFLRYLAALLGVDGDAGFLTAAHGGAYESWAGLRGDRILEDLLSTASRDPGRLAYLDETVEQLQRRSDAHDVIPPDFRALWDAVYAARRAVIR